MTSPSLYSSARRQRRGRDRCNDQGLTIRKGDGGLTLAEGVAPLIEPENASLIGVETGATTLSVVADEGC